MSDRLRQLQATLTDLALEPGDGSFRKDPKSFGALHGLAPDDQAAMARYKGRLLTYRGLVRFALTDPVPDCFPITKALLEKAGVWKECLDTFLASRTIQSPYYRDIHPAFVSWLAESGWGQERWPFLLQLAHYEYLELDVLRHPDEDIDIPMQAEPDPDLLVVFDGAVRNMAYAYRVHEATAEEPVPSEGQALLFCFRDPKGDFHWQELKPETSAFLSRCEEGRSIGAAASEFDLDLEDVQDLLRDLRDEGAILGFAKNEG